MLLSTGCARRLGAEDPQENVLVKPYTQQALLARVAAAIEGERTDAARADDFAR